MSQNVVRLFKDAPDAPPPDTPDQAFPATTEKGHVPVWARSARALRTAATHEHTRTTGRLIARHTLYVAGGTRIVTRRAWDGRTAARYERMMRAAEAAGQFDEAKEWEDRGRQFRAARHARRMDLVKAPQTLAKSAAVGGGLTAGGLLALGTVLAIANKDPSWILTPTTAVIDLIGWVAFIVAVVWDPLVLAAPWAALGGLWAVGAHQQAAPQWALPAHQRDDGAPITPSIVVTALRDLGIAALKNAIKEMGDAGAGMLSPIVLAGCGVEVEALLPSGVSTEEVMNRRRKLAENLGRHEHEVFVTKAVAARTVNLWIADSGALDEPIGPSPLVTDPDTTANYKTGRAPWGVDLRGDAALLSVHQCHFLITGLSNQGKALALDTPIPTPSGWTTMGALNVGDHVFGIDGNPCNVIAAHDVMHDHPCYEVEFNDGTTIVADAEHLWYTETAISRRSERAQCKRSGVLAPRGTDQQWKREMASVKTTEEIAATVRHKTASRDEANHSIPLAAPLNLPEQALPIDPYTLGIWLGDGSSANGLVTLNRGDSAEIISGLAGEGHLVPSADKPGCVGYHVDGLSSRLRAAGLRGNKHIPREYLRASEAQRRALLAGLMDSDGTIDAGGTAEFAVCTRALADDAAELIQSLGYKVRRCEQRVNGRTEATSINFRTAFVPNEPVFRLQRKNARVRLGERRLKSARRYIVAVRPVESVPVRCIGVDSPNRLFLASRSFIATHNTASLRAMALWLAHDVTVEFRVADLKGIGDWSCMDGIATVLIEGPTDDHVIAATEMMEDGVNEMQRRLLAPKGTTFNPLVLAVDEAQVAYGSGAIGDDKRPYGGSKATSRYFQAVKAIHDQGRAVNVTTWEGTQDPTNENLPKRSREGNHIRAALVLGTEEQAKMALGAKAIDGGAAPHKLRQGLDKGVVVVAGDGVKLAPGQSSITIRTHFINDTEADDIAQRIKARRSGVKTRARVEPAEPVDHLADISEAIGDEPRMRTQEVLQRLAQRNPGEYRDWTFPDLTAALEPHGAAPKKTNGGLMYVIHARVLEALADRDKTGDTQ